ncbi:SDR family NAD(P)-dependent oxidoreductase [Candidatus Uabimicrobium sp. HlEnr_7]|uniref:SDR family NAD(P)-dependent oxidoreductase n=1 Tax=Candidatus Uabimicrobium helgolandensis TaxID=3095367 RepID=UPI003557A022
MEKRSQALIHGEKRAHNYNTFATYLEKAEQIFIDGKFIVVQINGFDKVYPYKKLFDFARRILHFFRQSGHKPQDIILVDTSNIADFIAAFWACAWGGFIIVPVPAIDNIYDKNVQAIDNISKILQSTKIYSDNSILKELYQKKIIIESLQKAQDFEPHTELYSSQASDHLVMLMTSGTTGKSKLAIHTQHTLIVPLLEITNTIKTQSFVYWHQLHHISGMRLAIPNLQTKFYIPTYLMMQKPLLWFECINRYRITNAVVSNSFLRHFLDYMKQQPQQKWDLSCVKHIGISGEAINSKTVSDFYQQMKPYGLKLKNIAISYGMTEMGNISGRATYNEKEILNPPKLKSVGMPSRGVSIRIVNKQNKILLEKQEGKIQVRSQGCIAGYYGECSHDKLFNADNWMETGDMGFIDAKALYITGRTKEIIIINAKNYNCSEIESSVNDASIIACGIRLENSETDSLLVFFETDLENKDYIHKTIKTIHSSIQQHFGFTPQYVIPITSQEIPRTVTGKVQRSQLQKQFTKGDFNSRISSQTPKKFLAPQNTTQELVTRAFVKNLKCKKISIHDNFFELGGHSLIAITIISDLNEMFNLELPFHMIFQAPTVEKISQIITNNHQKSTSITPLNLTEYPLSSIQRQLWFSQQLQPKSSFYNMSKNWLLEGKIDREILQLTLEKLVARQTTLRTALHKKTDGDIVQIIHNKKIPLAIVNMGQGTSDQQIQNEIDKVVKKPFTLTEFPLVRFKLIHLSHSKHILCIVTHHILNDYWSMNIIWNELVEFYNSLKAQKEHQLPLLKLCYGDFCAWQEQQKTDYLQQYWLQKCCDISILELPTDKPRPKMQSFSGAAYKITINKQLEEKIITLAQDNNCTLFMTLVTAFNILLSRYSGQNDIVIGSPIANRDHRNTQNIVGFFVNNLVLRNDLSGNPRFLDFLQKVKQVTIEAYQYQDYPFEKLVEDLNPIRDNSRNPIFQVLVNMFDIDNIHTMKNLDGVSSALYPTKTSTTLFDITMYIQRRENLSLTFRYSTDLFNSKTIEGMAKNFIQLLESIANTPDRTIHQLKMSRIENCTLPALHKDMQYKEKTVIDLIQESVLSVPDKIALFGSGKEYTYTQLDVLSNNVCNALRNAGVKTENSVVLLSSPSIDSIVAMLGILKSGGTCIPVNPDFISTKEQSIIEKAQVVLCNKQIQKNIDCQQVITIENCITYQQTQIPKQVLYDNQAAFVIYTSGSTGSASGVVITHRNIASKVQTISKSLAITPNDTCILTASISFIAAIRQIFTPLIQKAKLVIVEANTVRDPLELFYKVAKHKVTVIDFVPSYCKTCAQVLLASEKTFDLHSIRQIATSGEKLSLDIVTSWRNLIPQVRFLNIYGQTETTAGVSLYEVPQQADNLPKNTPAGRAVGSNKIYILNPYLQPVPQGAIGDIYIEGNEIARNYYMAPVSTALKFIPNPFGDGILYKTEDRGRYNSQQQLEIIARTDAIIKVRGYRVDKLEIETSLRKHSLVKDAAIIFCDDILKAYLLVDDKINNKDIQQYLQTQIAEYMIPQKIFTISQFPSTNSGKTDFLALQELDKEQRFIHSLKWVSTDSLPEKNIDQTYLLFADNTIAFQHPKIIAITHAKQFSANKHNIVIDYNNQQHYQQLVCYLQQINFNFKNIIYAHSNVEFFAKFINAFSTYLPQAQIITLCRNVFPVSNKNLIPENALIVGASRVLPLEYPGLRYACVDLQDQPFSESIFRELQHRLPQQNVVYVGNQRYKSTYQYIQTNEISIQDNQVYLITGGFGNIGSHIATTLAKKAKVKIAITTRSKDNISKQAQQTLDKIKEYGAEVAVFETSLDNENQVQQTIDKIQNQLGNIYGAMHCAGAREHFGLLNSQNIIDNKSLFKTQSSQLLVDILKTTSSSFLFLFSSLTSLFGRYGQASYAATNAYLDTFAHKHSTNNLRITSINWDVWRDFPVSIAEEIPKDVAELIRRDAQNGLSTEQAIKAVLTIPRLNYPQIIASKRPEITGYHIHELIHEANFIPPSTEMEKKICAIWKKALQIERISVEDDFFALGGHSLLVIVVITEIRNLLGIDKENYEKLPLATMLTYPTIKQFAKAISNLETASNQIIIQMNTKIEKNPPVFLLHAAGVDPIGYHHLCKCLDGTATTYTIRTHELDKFASIEKTARYHIEKMKSIQPKGPYFLGGMCMGGLVAYEVAKTLREQGNEVKLVFIMDAINIPGMKEYKTRRKHKLKRIGRKIKNLYKAVEFIGHLLILDINFIRRKIQRIKDNLKRKAKKVSNPRTKLQKKMRDRLRIMRDSYQPKSHEGEIIYIRSEKKTGARALARFQELATTVTCHKIEGTIHNDVSRPHFAEVTSDIIKKYLNEST